MLVWGQFGNEGMSVPGAGAQLLITQFNLFVDYKWLKWCIYLENFNIF